jgi:hypothetical protein
VKISCPGIRGAEGQGKRKGVTAKWRLQEAQSKHAGRRTGTSSLRPPAAPGVKTVELFYTYDHALSVAMKFLCVVVKTLPDDPLHHFSQNSLDLADPLVETGLKPPSTGREESAKTSIHYRKKTFLTCADTSGNLHGKERAVHLLAAQRSKA